MKKYLPYIFASLFCIAIALLLFGSKQEKEFDKRVVLNKQYKTPYGTYVAYNLLPHLFANSKIENNKKPPKDWLDAETQELQNTLFFIITKHFNPNEAEIMQLNRFVSQGNYVFISSPMFNKTAEDFFSISINFNGGGLYGNNTDSPIVQLRKPLFAKDCSYFYPGESFRRTLVNLNLKQFQILGTDEDGRPNFIKADVGKGSFYIHTDPFLFTNYFLLYKNNIDYFEKSLSVVPPSVKKIIWDEYYVYRLEDYQKPEEPSPLHVLLSIPAFKWAFWLAIIFIVLYLLLNVKRNQRIIPVIAKPKNESLDFVKVIGRLYFEKQDHLNLAQKMITYFLEHIRSRYFINTSALNEEFVKNLSGKSGYDEQAIREIVESIFMVQTTNQINQEQLTDLYKQFQKFYKHIA